MFFISKEMYMSELNKRVDEIMCENEKNREFSRLWERLHMLERRVEILEHPEPKDSRDVPIAWTPLPKAPKGETE